MSVPVRRDVMPVYCGGWGGGMRTRWEALKPLDPRSPVDFAMNVPLGPPLTSLYRAWDRASNMAAISKMTIGKYLPDITGTAQPGLSSYCIL